MCKVMVMAGIPEKNQAKSWKFVVASVPYMTENDKDGVGYAAVNRAGELFGERWLNPKDAFKVREESSAQDRVLKQMLQGAVNIADTYNNFGNVSNEIAAITLHSRMATCGKGLQNTHPFVSGDTSLIHNGVISNAHKLTNITSTCDSETILNEYLDNEVNGIPERIQRVSDTLEGYYACAVLTRDSNGKRILDIFKDARANLYVAHVPALGTYVFCTSPKILLATGKAAKMRIGTIHEINPGYLMRFDALSGKAMGVNRFNLEKSNVIKFSKEPATSEVSQYDDGIIDEMLAEPGYRERWATMTEAEIEADIEEKLTSPKYLKVR